MFGWLASLTRSARGYRYVSDFDVPAMFQVRKSILVIIYPDSRFEDIADPLKEFFRRNHIPYAYKWERRWAPALAFRSQEHLDAYVAVVTASSRHYTINGTAKTRIKEWLSEKEILHLWEKRPRTLSSNSGDFNSGGAPNPYIEGDLHLLNDADAVEMALIFNVHRKEWAENHAGQQGKHFYVGLSDENSD